MIDIETLMGAVWMAIVNDLTEGMSNESLASFWDYVYNNGTNEIIAHV